MVVQPRVDHPQQLPLILRRSIVVAPSELAEPAALRLRDVALGDVADLQGVNRGSDEPSRQRFSCLAAMNVNC